MVVQAVRHKGASRAVILASLVLMSAMAIDRANGGDSAKTGGPKTVAIGIKDYAFHDAEVKICTGDSIEWKNADDDPHTVTATDGSFDSKTMGKDEHFRHMFQTVGRFAYICAVHPFMKGAVIVRKCE